MTPKIILRKTLLFIMYLFFEEKTIRGYLRYRLRWYNPLNYPLIILWWIGNIVYFGIKDTDFTNPFKFINYDTRNTI